MRFKHWLTTILSTSLLAASTLTAQAQPPMGMAPGMAYDGYGGTPMPGSGPPPGYSPWPETSPYQNSFSQQTFNGGLWSESENNLTRRYRLNVEYLTGLTRTSDSFIGNKDAQTYPQTIQAEVGTQQGGQGGQGQNNQQGGILSPFLDSQANATVGAPLFRAFDFGKNDRKMNNQGARVIWGYDRADDSGIRLGFLTNQGTFDYNARDALPSSRDTQRDYALFAIEQIHIINELNAQGNTAAAAQLQSELTQLTAQQPTRVGRFNNLNQVLQNNIDNLGGLALNDGSLRTFGDGTKLGGVTVPYDLEFQIKLRSQLYGGNAEWVMSPILNWGTLKVRPTVGARYFYLQEGFRFFGQDSGLAYTSSQQQGGGGGGGGNQNLSPDIKIHAVPDGIDDDSDGIVDNAGGEGSGQQAGQGGQQNQQNTLSFFSFHDHFRYPITSYLNNDAEQHLGGGELGLSYDFGGDILLITGSTKVGLLANYSRLKLSGDNIAMHTRESNLLLASTADATPNSFTDEKTTAHVSPMFEQAINAEAPLFQYVPVLKRFSVFEKARFRAGYSILLIGGVADTAGSVLWQGNPSIGLFPKIQENRNTYSTHNYNVGVSWEY